MIAGAIIITTVTAAGRLAIDSAPEALWFVASAAALVAVAVAARRWSEQVRSCGYEVFVSERTGVSMRRLGEDTMPHALELSEAAMVGPEFAVLSLRPAHRAGKRHRMLEIAVVRAELDVGDARRLQRFLLWAQRAGRHEVGSSGKNFPG